MMVSDEVIVEIPGKGTYENCLEDGVEEEYLNGAGLRNGCYCKHYRRARDWSDKTTLDKSSQPAVQHYCSKHEQFLGWAYCCGVGAKCYETGKSAGVKRVLNRIRKRRSGIC